MSHVPVLAEDDSVAGDDDYCGAEPAQGGQHPGVGEVPLPAAEVVHSAPDDVALNTGAWVGILQKNPYFSSFLQ